MTDEKWFYSLQKIAKKEIDDKYEIMGYCNWQTITKDRVFENWTCKLDEKILLVTAILHKNGLVHLYECKLQ